MNLVLITTLCAICFSIYTADGRKQSSLMVAEKLQVKSVIDEGFIETGNWGQKLTRGSTGKALKLLQNTSPENIL